MSVIEVVVKMLRGIGVAIHSLLVMAVLLLLVASATLQGLALLQNTDTPMLFGRYFCPVTDAGMAPALLPGELVVLTPQQNYGTGDLVATTDENGYLLGRVMFNSSTMGCTLGNAQATGVRATGVHTDRILGAVTLQIPYVGAALAWAMTGTGMATLLAGGILLVDLPKWLSGKQDHKDAPEDADDEE